jgi:hypothetical protein
MCMHDFPYFILSCLLAWFIIILLYMGLMSVADTVLSIGRPAAIFL